MKKISQASIAKTLDITPAYFCQITTGVQPISYKLAYKWSKRFGQDMDWWLNAEPDQIKTFLFNQFNKER